MRPGWVAGHGLALCLLVALAGAEERYIEDTDRFPGWKGELPSDTVDRSSLALSQKATGKTVGFGENGKVRFGGAFPIIAPLSFHSSRPSCLLVRLISTQELWRGEVILVSWKPRAFLFKNFLTDEECDYMIKKACQTLMSYCDSSFDLFQCQNESWCRPSPP